MVSKPLIRSDCPVVLSLEQYRSQWEPQGWKLIIIGPTANWRENWGSWEAIRDIVQNALDEAEAYTWGYDEEGLWIADNGRGISVSDFLLGPPKLKADYARGKFGEGMKIAALAMIRKGYPVRVETVGRRLWIIFLEQEADGMVQTLAALWRPNGTRTGTRFHLIGYTGSAFEDRFAVNLPRSSIVAETPSRLNEPVRRFNLLIRHEFAAPPFSNRIYARDIFMREIKSPYSYNLWSFEMAPDRHAPKNEADLWTDIGRTWSCVNKVDHLKTFLQMVCDPPLLTTEESHQVNMESWDMGLEPSSGKYYTDFVRENASAWQEAWWGVMGANAVLSTNSRLDGMVRHLGYQPVKVTWGVREALARAIPTDKEIVKTSQERLREVKVIPEEKLETHHQAHLRLARAIAAAVFHPPPRVHVAIIPPASDRVRTAGMYSTTAGEIYISLEMMENCRSVIDTLVHEMGHHRQFLVYNEAEDLTPSHAEAMTSIAAEVVRIVSDGGLDELLQEVKW